MGLRIRTNVASIQAQRQLNLTTNASMESMEKLASGYRINKAADDAAGLAVSENYKSKIRSLGQAQRNANDGISLVQIAEGGMSEISNMLIRLRELAIQTASDTLSNEQRSFANKEYTQLVDEIDRISQVTEFNGIKLLQGAEANQGVEALTLHIGAGDGIIPNTDTIEIHMEPLQLRVEEDLNLGTGSEIGPQQLNEEFDRSEAAAKITVIDTALTRIAKGRATLGAQQNRLQSAISNLNVQIENLNTANSRVRDVDFAGETAKSTQSKILSNAGVSVLSQANQWPELVLSLLRI